MELWPIARITTVFEVGELLIFGKVQQANLSRLSCHWECFPYERRRWGLHEILEGHSDTGYEVCVIRSSRAFCPILTFLSSTFTATVTIPTVVGFSSTITDATTTTETVVASTETIVNLETTTDVTTNTETSTVATSITVEVNQPRKRQASTQLASTFPAYATPCTNFPKYSSACSCLGYFPDTVTVAAPSTTVTEYQTQTSTSTYLTTTSTTSVSTSLITDTTLVTSTVILATDTTTTTSTTATATATNIVTNGGFERGLGNRWIVTHGSWDRARNAGSPLTSPASSYALVSSNMYNNNLFEFWQALPTVPGTTYTCSYDWKFTRFYSTYYRVPGVTYVPYVHVYIQWDDPVDGTVYDIFDNVQPAEGDANKWQRSTFQFTAKTSGDQLYFDCASPQSKGPPGPGNGDNYLYLDNVVCVASS